MNKTALVPCIVHADGVAEKDSLAANVQRGPMHPLDQCRAFQAMCNKDCNEESESCYSFSGCKVRTVAARLAPRLCLRLMAGSVKLRCGDDRCVEGPVRADFVEEVRNQKIAA